MRVTLWEAVDRDRSPLRRLRVQDLPTALTIAAAITVAILSVAQFTTAAGNLAPLPLLVMFACLTLVAWIWLSLLRPRRTATEQAVWLAEPFSAVPSSTAAATHSVSVASGIAEPDIVRMRATGINAILFEMAGSQKLAVTEQFSELPPDEQAAGITMLVGRGSIGDAPAVLDRSGEPLRVWDPIDFELQQAIYDAWTGAASAGDREALLMLKNPVPLVRLLRRLSLTPSVLSPLPELREGFFCLAWPFATDNKGAGPLVLAADRRRFDLMCSVIPDGRAQREEALDDSESE